MGRRSIAYENQQLGKYLDAQASAVARLYPEVRRRLSGTPLHSLRVAGRRAQAAIWILKNSGEKPQIKKLRHDLKGLVGALGKVRALDVAVADAKHFGIDSASLTSRRKAAQTELRGWLDGGRQAKLAKHFATASALLRSSTSISTSLAREKLRAQLAKLLRAKRIHPKDFHQLRIKLKKVRYVLEAMGKNSDVFRGLQKVLGNTHDLKVLEDLTGEHTLISIEQALLNKQARRLIGPAIRIAMNKLREPTSP